MKRPLRIVILGNWSQPTYFTLGCLEGSILNGCWARVIDIKDNYGNIRNHMKFSKPDIIICHMILGQPDELIQIINDTKREFGTKVFYQSGDARTEPRKISPCNHVVDFALTNHDQIEKYENIWKVPCFHWPYGCLQQDNIAETNKSFERNWIFTGGTSNNQHHGPRAKMIQKLKEKRNDILVLPQDKRDMVNTMFLTPEIAASAKAILGCQMGTDIPLYQDVRPFQYIGAGALYFHDKHPNMDFFFKSGKHYVSYERDNVDDLIKQWKYYVVDNPDKGKKIRMYGFQFCQTYHSVKERIKMVIDILDGKEVNTDYSRFLK